jgi:hypothetical protein
MMTAPLITSLLVHTQHLMTAQLTVQWTPLPLRYHLTTYTYKNTFIIINNNKTYLIIQTKTRPHKLLTAGAPAKPSHSRSTQLSHRRSTSQAFSQQEHSAFSQHEHQAFSQQEHHPSLFTAGVLSFFTPRAPSLLTVEGSSLIIEGAQLCQVFFIISGPVAIRGC